MKFSGYLYINAIIQIYHIYFIAILNIIRKEMQVKPNNKLEIKSNNSIKKVSTIVKKGYKQALKNNKLIFQDQEKSL